MIGHLERNWLQEETTAGSRRIGKLEEIDKTGARWMRRAVWSWEERGKEKTTD